MRDSMCAILERLLGRCDSVTTKSKRWHTATLDVVVVNLDQAGNKGRAFMTFPNSAGEPPFGEVYGPGRGRHTDTFPMPTLRKGRSALLLKVDRREQLPEFEAYLRRVLHG